jgi:hypothetical protein
MKLVDAIMTARKIKMTLDKRVVGFMEVKQDQSVVSHLQATQGKYNFNVLLKVPSGKNFNAVRQTVIHFGGTSEFNVIQEEDVYKIGFTLGERK